VIQSFVAAGLSPEVIFLLDGIDWLKYLVALFFFFLGLFAGWWQWHYQPLLAQLQEVPEPVARGHSEKPDSEGGGPPAVGDSGASLPAVRSDAEAAVEDPLAEALADSSTPEESDDLRLIRGIGAALEVRLNQQGVYRFSQIANWDPAEIANMSEKLHLGQQIERFSWVEQAKSLQNSD